MSGLVAASLAPVSPSLTLLTMLAQVPSCKSLSLVAASLFFDQLFHLHAASIVRPVLMLWHGAGGPIGKLEGVPIVIKEALNVAGFPSTFGWNYTYAGAGVIRCSSASKSTSLGCTLRRLWYSTLLSGELCV